VALLQAALEVALFGGGDEVAVEVAASSLP
jgi:hypothetical protein